jgi:hypothetical protein
MRELDEVVCLRSKVGLLESQIDMLLAERAHLDRMLVKCGFLEGIPTLMKTVEEVLDSGELDGYGGGNYRASSDA